MNQRDLFRFNVITKVHEKRLKVLQAAEILGISVRQVLRLSKAVKKEGAKGLISKKIGAPSNRQLRPGIKEQVLEIIHEHYMGFGPTLVQECLAERHDINISRSTVRNIMMQNGLWPVITESAQGM